MLPALNQIGTQQSAPTINTMKAIKQLLDYANTYKNTNVRFYACDMKLEVDSDAAYLVLPKARSRIAGYFRLLDDASNTQRSLPTAKNTSDEKRGEEGSPSSLSSPACSMAVPV